MSGFTTVVRDDDGLVLATVTVEGRVGSRFVHIHCEADHAADSFSTYLHLGVARVLAFMVHEVLP